MFNALYTSKFWEISKKLVRQFRTYLERHFYNFTERISIIYGEGAYGAGAYGAGAYGAGAYGAGAYGAVRPLGPVFFANFSKLGGI